MSFVRSTSCLTFGGAQGYRFVRVNRNDSPPSSRPVDFLHHFFQRCCAFTSLMNCYDRKLRQTRPESESNRPDRVVPPKRSRVNGWSFPLHSFQFIAWFFYIYLVVVGFGIFIPLLPYSWKYAGYCIFGTAFIVHLVAHLVAVSVDPADFNVRAKHNYNSPLPALDRTKHPHAIQNLHCYLCEVDVGQKAKHCSSCNKCISDFDHHCKWLNNCVGGRNYWFFFSTVATAVFGIFMMVVISFYIFIEHYVNPSELRTAPQFQGICDNTTWLAFLPLTPIETGSAGILVAAFFTFFLGTASLLLLGHLLGFHIYLLIKKMSTYEYIIKQRSIVTARGQDGYPESSRSTPVGALSLEVPMSVETAIDCDAPLSARSSAFKYRDSMQVSARQSNSTYMEEYHVSKIISPPGDNAHYNQKQATHTLSETTKESLASSGTSWKTLTRSQMERVDKAEETPTVRYSDLKENATACSAHPQEHVQSLSSSCTSTF
ncbi:palmitoyltransferase ZDHHC11 isoform X2 [Polypterus senegalus]|uniref:palmitoyltransferase ZDHHC11 isoform X2 n=1 Tax=Polypterus senegalus TaxID=55291 RepID=UPI00196337D9|nr:palmitoyltransferase ZDHHC11 isoform X2 [Polypterus senegalus]